jgi:hypothetical protein
MLKKTLIAMAVAGALGCSAGAFAESGTHHGSYYNSLSSLSHPVHLDDDFDGVWTAEADTSFDDATAVGSTSASAGGTVAFSSDGRAPTQKIGAEEVYLVPAPLAAADGVVKYWKTEIKPSNVDELDRLATENVYMMTPIEDAIADPQLVLKYGVDAYASWTDDSVAESSSEG